MSNFFLEHIADIAILVAFVIVGIALVSAALIMAKLQLGRSWQPIHIKLPWLGEFNGHPLPVAALFGVSCLVAGVYIYSERQISDTKIIIQSLKEENKKLIEIDDQSKKQIDGFRKMISDQYFEFKKFHIKYKLKLPETIQDRVPHQLFRPIVTIIRNGQERKDVKKRSTPKDDGFWIIEISDLTANDEILIALEYLGDDDELIGKVWHNRRINAPLADLILSEVKEMEKYKWLLNQY